MKKDKPEWSHCCSGSGFAVVLIIIGGFFLARDLNWIPANISFWAIALIALGAYFLVKKKSC